MPWACFLGRYNVGDCRRESQTEVTACLSPTVDTGEGRRYGRNPGSRGRQLPRLQAAVRVAGATPFCPLSTSSTPPSAAGHSCMSRMAGAARPATLNARPGTRRPLGYHSVVHRGWRAAFLLKVSWWDLGTGPAQRDPSPDVRDSSWPGCPRSHP